MFSRAKLYYRFRISEIPSLPYCKQSTDEFADKSYKLIFFDDRVQDLLKKLSNFNLDKLFEPKGPRKRKIKYELLTTEQFENEMANAKKKAEQFMQIPPLITPKIDKLEIMAEDPGLDGHDIHHSKFVFTDLSFDIPNERRTIIVREANGTLRTASQNERFRMNHMYYPTPGRELELPKMFEDEHLKNVLNREDYKFILDRSCAQFELEDPMFHKVLELTFEQINDKSHFERLLSTRHFGCLAFYLVSHKKIDKMLIYNIKSERLQDAYNLVKLYHIVHPDCKSAELSSHNQEMDLLKNFIKLDAKEKDVLELTLQNYSKKAEDKRKLEVGIREAHGL